MNRSRLTFVLTGLTGALVIIALMIGSTPRWQLTGAKSISDVECRRIGAAVRTWYRSEAWQALGRGEFRAAGDWALRSITVNRLQIVSHDGESTVAEIGWLRNGQFTADLTISLSRTSNRWTVESAVW
ncbi:MAG: hypothetical protein U0795_08065 [Pirellulales bacterium]